MISYFPRGSVAEEELENLKKWKEEHRAKPVHLVPRQLGKQAAWLSELGKTRPPVDPVSTKPRSVFACVLQTVGSLGCYAFKVVNT